MNPIKQSVNKGLFVFEENGRGITSLSYSGSLYDRVRYTSESVNKVAKNIENRVGVPFILFKVRYIQISRELLKNLSGFWNENHVVEEERNKESEKQIVAIKSVVVFEYADVNGSIASKLLKVAYREQ